ncbi:kinesin family protein [Skeletonema marinoi]|uniref:Kinesin family protein n=1 Tax=Skeletonema marinoi TaxID=267567 RepID=A0AAD9DBH0_9STRA|nr:kinesin family protein [Skeletonema marinoi]
MTKRSTRIHWAGNRDSISITTSLRFKPSPGDTRTIQGEFTSFSHFFDSAKGQLQCYSDACSRTIEEFLSGRNCTVFVYGQTGSGKTHTLFGPPNSFHSNTLKNDATEAFHNVKIPVSWGAFPRIVLSLLNNSKISSGITATAVEIYMDNCYDLMRDGQKIAVEGFGRSRKVSGRGSFLETAEIKRDSAGKWIPPRTLVDKPKNEGYEMRGAKSLILTDVHTLLEFMSIVEATRTSKSHKLNERSSRSHCVITLSIPSISNAKYMCVDLAGSERIMKTGTIDNDLKAAEARNINTSLTSLGRCINALASGNPSAFVPYRDSVLTMLLKQSLGGSCYTSVIITGTEDATMHSETMSSIQFGMRCSRVSNKEQAAITQIKRESGREEAKGELLAELRIIDEEIQSLVDTGRSGGLNLDFPNSLRQSFSDNMGKYYHHKSALAACKQQVKAGQTGSEKARQYEESQVKNLQGILLRSMTTGVYTDPCSRYIKIVQRRIDIISTLRGMNVDVTSIPNIEVPLTLEHLARGYEG